MNNKYVCQSGFGLVELMVSISIMGIVSAVVFSNQSSYNGAVLLRGQSYEIALHIREIQLSAVSAMGEGGAFRSVYGLYFNSSSGSNNKYTVFKDSPSGANANGHFNTGVGEEFGMQGILDGRFEIREIRTVSSAGVKSPVTDINVVFARPNFDARFFRGGSELTTQPSIEIDISRTGNTGSGAGDVRTVEITRSGQIAVLPLVVSGGGGGGGHDDD